MIDLDKKCLLMHPYFPNKTKKNESPNKMINNKEKIKRNQENNKETIKYQENNNEIIKNQENNKETIKPKKNETKNETIKKIPQNSSEFPTKNNRHNNFQAENIEENNQHKIPETIELQNSLQRKSISLERSKYSEIMQHSPSKDQIKNVTFNNDTPKKVSLPKNEDHENTNKRQKDGFIDVFNEKKPTNLEYSAFINSQNYYEDKIGEIMNKFQENTEIEDDEEKTLGKVNVFDLKRSLRGPPSFSEIKEKEQEKPKNSLDSYKINEENSEDFKTGKGRTSQETIKENYYGNRNDNMKDDCGMKNKNALVIYYDNNELGSNEVEINLNEFECKYYNLFNNKVEKLVLKS